jgi:hypothetical protein
MEATTNTIAASTIATEEMKIQRPVSPTPSEESIYYDPDDEEVTVSPNSTSRNSQNSVSKDAEQESPSRQIPIPSTPPARPIFSLQTFDKFEISPTSSYERSPCSTSFDDDEPESPITARTRSRNSSFESSSASKLSLSEGTTTPLSTTKEKKHPCLQCHLLGLKCSFTTPKARPAQRYRPQFKHLTCTRCTRNSESFCIHQVAVETDQDAIEKKESVHIYYVEGVEKEVVTERVEEMLEERRVKRRFELPKMTMWKRQMLRPVFAREGSWAVKEGSGVKVES